MLPPSDLPSGNTLRDHAISALSNGTVAERLARQLVRDARYRNLLPERAFQRMYEAVGAELYRVFDLLSPSRPNAVHHLLARLAQLTPVLTTNFDLLIESAGAGIHVTHLHGRLDEPSDMIVRIEQVGVGLLPAVRRAVSRAVRSRDLFIMGYSGRDKDVVQAINLAKPGRVWWTDIVEPPGITALTATDVRFSRSDLVGMVAHASAALSLRLPAIPSYTTRMAAVFPSLNVPDWQRLFCVSKLAAECGQMELSVRACEQAAPLVGRSQELIFLAAQAILSLKELGRLPEARTWLQRGLANANNAPDDLRAGIYNADGYMALEHHTPDVRHAVQALRRAARHQLRYAARLRAAGRGNEPLVFLARIWNNIGWAYHLGRNYARGEHAYRESLRLKRKAGDLPGIAFTTANVARLLYEAGDRARAAHWRARARRLCRDAGLPAQEASIVRDMAKVAIAQHRPAVAARYLEEASRLVDGTDFVYIKQSIDDLKRQLPP